MRYHDRDNSSDSTDSSHDSIFGDFILSGKTSVSRNDSWVEGFDTSVGNSGVDVFTENRLGRIINERMWFYLIAGMIAIAAVILLRAAFLQLYEGNAYRALAEGNRIRPVPILPKRGLIYDTNGIPLATNIPLFLLTLRASDLPQDANARNELFTTLERSGIALDRTAIEEELLEKAEVVIAELPYEEALAFMATTQDLEGAGVSVYERRSYENPVYFSHVIGYLGPVTDQELPELSDNYLINDYLGKTGVEFVYEEELRGVLGVKNTEVDSKGKEEKVTAIDDPQHGYNLHLTLDKQVQEKLYDLLDEALAGKEHKRAAAIVVNPNNGEVISLVSYPGYNNQEFYQGLDTETYREVLEDPNKPLFNRALSGQYPPGSTFKTIMAVAGLEDGKITPRTTYLSTGGIQVSRWFFPDWRAGGHGQTNIYKAIADSVNTFFYILGGGYNDISGLGVDRIRQKALEFGLLATTGIDLTNEATGFFPSPDWKREVKNEQWYIGDTYNLSIGQGDILVTPLQMTMVTSAIANGGTLYQPHVIKHFSTRDDTIIAPGKDWVTTEQVGDLDAIQIVKRAMRETVLSGSARSMQTIPAAISGKTGTAQWHSTKDPHAWFIGFAPYDEPEIAFTFLLEESVDGGGSQVAVPIARSFLSWYFTEYTLSKNLN